LAATYRLFRRPLQSRVPVRAQAAAVRFPLVREVMVASRLYLHLGPARMEPVRTERILLVQVLAVRVRITRMPGEKVPLHKGAPLERVKMAEP